MTAQALGRVHKTLVSILLDSGSGISVVSKSYADRHLRECRSYRYNGPRVTVANTTVVEPIGYIDAEVQLGDSTIMQRFTVFPS